MGPAALFHFQRTFSPSFFFPLFLFTLVVVYCGEFIRSLLGRRNNELFSGAARRRGFLRATIHRPQLLQLQLPPSDLHQYAKGEVKNRQTKMEWMMKRVIKFGLKKLLGKFILGELDLEGLEVQVGAGRVQLNHLQLNTDYLNQQLGAATISVKEGVISNVSIKFPWKVPIDNCEVELEGIELVLSPRTEVKTSECTDACSSSEAYSKENSLRLTAEHVKDTKVHERGVFNYPGVHDGVQMIVKKVENLLLGLRVKIKNLVIAFEEGTKTSSTALGFESCCQSQSILVLRMPEIEYGTGVSGSSCESTYPHPEDSKGVVMLMPIIKFCGARIDLYDAPYMDSQAKTVRHIASILTGNEARSDICDNLEPIIEGNDVGFSGSVQFCIPWKSGSADIPKIDAEILIDPVTLRLQLCTIERLIMLFYSLGRYKGTDSQPIIDSKNNGQNLGLDNDEHARYHCPGESVMTDGMFRSCAESFSSIPASTVEETVKPTLFPDSVFISNWMHRADLEESIDEFFECFDGARSFQDGPASSSLLGLTYSIFSAITAASTLSTGVVLINSGEQRVECILKTKLVGFSLILAIEDLDNNHSSDVNCMCTFSHMNSGRLGDLRVSSLVDINASFESSMEKSRFKCLEQEAKCWARENLFLEANFQDLKFTVQVTDEEVGFEAGMKHFEIFEYLPEDGEKTVNCSFSNCEEHIKTSMLSISSLQSKAEDVLPSFPLSLQTSNAAKNMANMVKVQLLTSESDSDNQISLIYQFADSNLSNSKISCTKFDVQLEPFVLWVDFYMANRLWHLIQAIQNVYGKFNKVSDEPTNDHSSTGGDDVSKVSIQGSVLVSSSRLILCFPKESSKSINPHCLTHNFLCIDMSDSARLSKSQPKRFLKQEESSLKDCYISSSSSISLNLGECNLFLIQPNNEGEWMCGTAKELSLQARKVFSVCSEKEKNYSTIGIQWQEVPGSGSRIAEKAWESANNRTRETESTKVIPNNQEFIRATTAAQLEDNDSHIREKMIQSSSLFIFFSLPYAKVDLYGSEHIMIVNLLSDLIDCVSFDGHTRISSNSENHDSESQSCTSEGLCSNVSQISFLLECKVVDIAVHLKELLDIRVSMKKELPGLWADFTLRVQEFAILSVSNLEGVSGASYFWLSHDEGLLQGSLRDGMEKTSEADEHFCLLQCKSDVLRRGGGRGANVLSSGNAGTTIIHVSQPRQLQSITTVIIRCSTIIAPGGRLDWLASVISFFNQSANNKHQSPNTGAGEGTDINSQDSSYATSFRLELVDVAVSYEPYFRVPTISSSRTSVPPSSGTHSNCIEEECLPVTCVLAAASVCLSIQTNSKTVDKEYTIFLQDVGLLVLDISKRRSRKQGYDANALLSQGYVKIGEAASMKVVVRMYCQDGLLWEVTCNEFQILLKTCHDTTAALMRLGAQLQQLFAPDFEESFVHLQTRPSDGKQGSLMKVNRENPVDSSQENMIVDIIDGPEEDMDDYDSCEDTLTGFLDGILENAFPSRINLQGIVENGAVLGSTCKGQSHFLVSGPVLEEGCSLDCTATTPFMNLDYTAKDRIPCEPKEDIQVGEAGVFFPEFIENYYNPEFFARSQRYESKKLWSGEPERPRITKNMPSTNVADGNGVWYDTRVTVLENHCSEVNYQTNHRLQDDEDNLYGAVRACIPASKNLQALGRIVLRNFSAKWSMIAGSDWPMLNKCDSPANEECTRNESACLEVELHGVDIQYDAFPDTGVYASKISFSIHDLLILDHSENAPWKKVMRDYHSRLHPRETSAKALKLQLEAVKPDPSTPLEEYRLFVKLHPLRLHLDQSQLDFFINYFSQLAASAAVQGDSCSQISSNRSIPVHANTATTENNLLPFFQKCEIRPLSIHVNYIPHRVNVVALQGGNYAELLNLISWKGINLDLKHVEAAGVYGWARIAEIVIDEWLEDITQNQVHKLVKGAGLIRSLVAIGAAAAKLVSVPAEHYRKDRRLLKGMRKGVTAFLKSISLEALSCGVHLASGAHGILVHTESALGSLPPSFARASWECLDMDGKCNQPGDACQGLVQACESLTRGLERTAASLISNPVKSYNRGDGAGTAFASAFRGAPAAVVAPISAAAGAVHQLLLGVRNSLDPERKKESEEKYSGPLPALTVAD